MRKTTFFPIPAVDVSARFAIGAIVTEPNSEAPPPVARGSAMCHLPIIHHAYKENSMAHLEAKFY